MTSKATAARSPADPSLRYRHQTRHGCSPWHQAVGWQKPWAPWGRAASPPTTPQCSLYCQAGQPQSQRCLPISQASWFSRCGSLSTAEVPNSWISALKWSALLSALCSPPGPGRFSWLQSPPTAHTQPHSQAVTLLCRTSSAPSWVLPPALSSAAEPHRPSGHIHALPSWVPSSVMNPEPRCHPAAHLPRSQLGVMGAAPCR